ncbi:MAG: hypothetical protein EOP34_03775, partial [Rickettsiales bacterium]
MIDFIEDKVLPKSTTLQNVIVNNKNFTQLIACRRCGKTTAIIDFVVHCMMKIPNINIVVVSGTNGTVSQTFMKNSLKIKLIGKNLHFTETSSTLTMDVDTKDKRSFKIKTIEDKDATGFNKEQLYIFDDVTEYDYEWLGKMKDIIRNGIFVNTSGGDTDNVINYLNYS